MSTAAGARRNLLVCAAALVVVLGIAWPVQASTLATLELSVNRAMPGEEVAFRGWYYNDVHPVVIHWRAVDGPVLATVTPEKFGLVHNHFRSIAGTLRIPPDAQPGTHLLVATQDFSPPGKITWGVPARAKIQVGEGAALRPGPAERLSERRPDAVLPGGEPSTSGLVAAAAAGAAVAGLLVGLTVLARRRRPVS